MKTAAELKRANHAMEQKLDALEKLVQTARQAALSGLPDQG